MAQDGTSADPVGDLPDARPRVALVLGGGGARGIAHLGVLEALEALQVPVDLVVGTSMGAIVGALYASGRSPAELEAWLWEADWDNLFRDEPAYRDLSFRRKREMQAFPIQLELGLSRHGLSAPSGLIAGQKLSAELRRLLLPVATVDDFDRLPIPFRAIATDLETGEVVVLSRGDLVDAVRASMSAPAVFAPTELGGRVLVDGGLARNLPADVARSAGADVLIVVDVGTPLAPAGELTSPLRVARQVATMLTQSTARAQRDGLTERDILIQPALADVGATDFGSALDALQAGRQAASDATEALARLARPGPGYDAWLRELRAERPPPAEVDYVVLGDPAGRSRTQLLPHLRAQPGTPLDTAAIAYDVARLYGLGIYDRVDYRLAATEEGVVLSYDPRNKPWGPSLLRFRLSVADNLAGDAAYNFAVRLRVPQLNAWGAEAVAELEFGNQRRLRLEAYQPLGVGSPAFLLPHAQGAVVPTDIYAEGRAVARYRTAIWGGGLAGGVALGHWGEARAGVEAVRVDARPRIGGADMPTLKANLARVVGAVEVTTIDDPLFPRHGVAAGLHFRSERPELGSDHPHDRLAIHLIHPLTIERVTILMGVEAGTALRGSLPAFDLYSLGAFLHMTAYRPGELAGNHFLFGRVIPFLEVVPDRVFAGLALETGNAWEARRDASLHDLHFSIAPVAGFRTFLGPVYLGYGFGRDGRRQAHLSVGRSP